MVQLGARAMSSGSTDGSQFLSSSRPSPIFGPDANATADNDADLQMEKNACSPQGLLVEFLKELLEEGWTARHGLGDTA